MAVWENYVPINLNPTDLSLALWPTYKLTILKCNAIVKFKVAENCRLRINKDSEPIGFNLEQIWSMISVFSFSTTYSLHWSFTQNCRILYVDLSLDNSKVLL